MRDSTVMKKSFFSQQTVTANLAHFGKLFFLLVLIDMIRVKAADVFISPNNCVTGGSTTSELTCNVSSIIQLWTFAYVQLLNRPYENEVTLNEHN